MQIPGAKTNMLKQKSKNLILTAATAALLSACTQGTTGLAPTTTAADAAAQGQGGAATTPEKAFNRFPDIPVPTQARMDNDRTLVFGSGESWYGQLGLGTEHAPDTMFDFYKQELTGFGWQEVTSVRAPVSILTYERQGRVLSIQIEKGTINGAKVTLTVSPRGGAAPVMN